MAARKRSRGVEVTDLLNMPKLTMTGQKVPQLTFGMGTSWSKRGDFTLSRQLIETVKTAIRHGFTYLDCSDNYNTERELGVAIDEVTSEGVFKREDVFVTTKCMNMVDDPRTALENSLEALNLQYVDLYLIHTPFKYGSEDDLTRAWALMEQLQLDGLARSIGVSNFRIKDLEVLIRHCKLKPAVNQVEFHPYLQQRDLREYLNKTGIEFQGYGPLVSIRGDDCLKDGPIDAYIKKLAVSYNVTEDAILLRWQIQNNISFVTTTSKAERLRSYLISINRFQLAQSEVNEISRLGGERHFRAYMVGPGRFDPHDAT